jgi:TrwC relaxase
LAVVVTVAKGYDLDYIWKTQGQASGARTPGGYYINAAQAGEPPGRWWGPGAQALGFTSGQVVEREPYDAVYQQRDPRTGDKLGRARGRYATFADHLAQLKAAEPHATAERVIELEREAAQVTRQPAAYTDVTVSFSKSISVLHASIRENARRARLAGDGRALAYWSGREERFQEILHRANRAALDYLQEWAGVTRTGYHGVRVDGQEPGRFEEAGLVVTSWLQGTSRDGDPQDHIHNQIARITRTVRDGKWRALDTASLRAVLGALQGVAATAVECELTREFGVAWVPRADGRGNEIAGVTQAQMDAYSTRTVQVHEKERELAQEWERRHGRAPTSRELLYIANDATLRSRKGKDAVRVDWDALAARWDASLGGQLAGIAATVSNVRGPDATAPAAVDGSGPVGPLSREAQVRAVQKALALVSEKQSAWTRHDLVKQLALVMPADSRRMSAQAARELLLGLAEEALSGRGGDVVCLEAPEWPPLPASAAPGAGRAQRLHAAGGRAVRHRRAAVGRGAAGRARAGAAGAAAAGRAGGAVPGRRRGASGGAAARTRARRASAGYAQRAAAGSGGGGLARADLGPDRRGGDRPSGDGQDPGAGRRRAGVGRTGVRHRDLAERHQRAPQRRCPRRGEHDQASGRPGRHPAGLADRGGRRVDGVPGPSGHAHRVRGAERLQAGAGR